MRSISCQVDEIEKPVIGQNESGDSTEFGLPNSNAIQVGTCRPYGWFAFLLDLTSDCMN